MIGKVLKRGTKRAGLQIFVEDIAMEGSELNLKKKEQVEIAINNKLKVAKRPNNTALLVFFDDYIAFSRDRDKKEISNFLDSAFALLKDQYIALSILRQNFLLVLKPYMR